MEKELKTKREKTENNSNFKQKIIFFYKQIILPLIVATMIIIPIRTLVAQPFFVKGESMEPNLHSWDYLIVDVFTYKFLREPQRGDVVIITPPNNKDVYYIKRVIGLPNETIEIKDGKVFIRNSQSDSALELKEPYISSSNMSHDNLVYSLDSDEYFVMGDNRAHSSDSRFFGPIKRYDIKARAFLRLFPFNKIEYLPAQSKD